MTRATTSLSGWLQQASVGVTYLSLANQADRAIFSAALGPMHALPGIWWLGAVCLLPGIP